ncbi:serpin B6-like [Physella acuta]|uniref:serpin B6-like n=1 Tax=Physella acuta TaxID=109671 RepID=UPI0027DBB9B7|nr:serpin B6-like [Physella acuta]
MAHLVVILAIAGQLVSADPIQQLALSAATSGFSQRLYQKVALGRDNVVLSPYSIHSALTMTSIGARGNTATEMAETLGVGSLGSTVHTAYRELITELNSYTDVEINTCSAIFLNPKYEIETQFVEDVRNNYFAEVDNFNLSVLGGNEKKINDFISEATKNNIQHALKEDFIKPNTVMLLVSTIIFNATWKFPFYKEMTLSGEFYKPGGLVSEVQMMNGLFKVSYKHDNINKVGVVELPFRGERFSLFIALPEEIDGISNLEQLLATHGMVDELLTGLIERSISSISIPKFTIETELELSESLKSLGMEAAFESADFTGMVKDGQADVAVDKVIHITKIDVMETGTVAAAATAGYVVDRGHMGHFNANHPFLFFIRDSLSGLIFFQGKFSG